MERDDAIRANHKKAVEAIRHSEKPTSMTIEEWKSIDEIARSTIRMHLAENFYFSMAKEMTSLKLWERLQAVYEKHTSSSKLILIRKLFDMNTRETDPVTSHINTFSQVLCELSSHAWLFTLSCYFVQMRRNGAEPQGS